MKLIAHRGNTNGPNKELENNPKYIDLAISNGFDVEIDVRNINGEFYLGHDNLEYQISMSWLVERKNNLWIHCKDLKSLEIFSYSSDDLHYFWHQTDDFTLTSKNYIWTYPGKSYGNKSIIVMPEIDNNLERKNFKSLNCFGICSDYVS